MYAYTTTSAAGHTFSPECAWEEWHAALDENAPEGMDLNAQGVCCHTHQTIVVDTLDDAHEVTEAPVQAETTDYDMGLTAGLIAYHTAAWFERSESRSKAYRAGYSDGWAQAYRIAHNLPAFK